MQLPRVAASLSEGGVIPMIKQFADRHDLAAHMVVVADAGMLSVTNLRELDRARLLAVSASWSSCAGWSGVNVTAAAGGSKAGVGMPLQPVCARPAGDPNQHRNEHLRGIR